MNEAELSIDDFAEDRYARLRIIPWWDQKRLLQATVMVVGAGAIGNEIIKNLALLGIGRLLIIDMDNIEQSNLTRSILFRDSDVGQPKAKVAARSAIGINPDCKAKAFVANVIDDIGLGVYRRMSVVLGGLDNREARLAINQACFHINVPWIDGAIEALNGFARVFMPPEGACYECTMTSLDWKLLNNRRSCSLLSHDQILEGKIPTTPTSSSVIAGIEVQEMLKLLHSDRNLPNLCGKGFVFNGLTHDSYVVKYQRKDDCMSHDPYSNIIEKQWSARTTSIQEILHCIQNDLGPNAELSFDRDIAVKARCVCGERKELFTPVRKLKTQDILCESCGRTMSFESTHTIFGNEDFIDKTLFDIGIPPLDIVTGHCGNRVIHYELSADVAEIFLGL